MSGATLIAVAIAAFVLLVSAQVFTAWPIAALGGQSEPHLSDARATSAAPATASTTVNPAATAAAGSTGTKAAGEKRGGAAKPAADPVDVASSDTAPVGSEPSAGESPSSGEGGGSNPPARSPSSSAQAPASSGPSSSSSSSSSGSSTAPTPTGKLTETVSGVDEAALGGTLGKTGVTTVTEGVVETVVGPESVVGHTVDETLKTVGGLLGAQH